jgi:RNA polymerase sigma factor (sigma-70 family)
MAETEAVLLRRFTRMGDAEAFAEIVRRHAGLVYGAALRILADVDRASDVAQETFLQLTRDAATVTDSLPGWLHQVATHKAIDRMRRDASRRHREMRYAAERPCETTAWRDISPCVDEELNELDPELRDILIQHFLQGHTTREIAGVRGVSQATISRRLEAGVEQLRAGLRRRGIIVAIGVLSALLGENALKAAPPILLTELGKMALVGGSAAISTAGAVGTTSGLHAAAAGVVAAVKANAVAVVAVAVIGAGSVVTYRQATRPSSSRVTITPSAESAPSNRPRRVLTPVTVSESQSAPAPGRSQAAEEWDALMKAALNRAGGRRGGTPTPPPSGFQSQLPPATDQQETTPAAEGGGGMMGGFGGMAASAPPQEDNSDQQSGQAGGMGFYAVGSSDGGWYVVPAEDPNNPDASGEP